MTMLRKLCILIIITTLYSASFTQSEKDLTKGSKDSEAELLDKEYGVKYADACEGKFP